MKTFYTRIKDVKQIMSHRLSFAKKIASKAGELVLEYYNGKPFTVSKKAGEENYVTDADITSEKFIINEIRKKFPQDAVLSEESENITNKESKYTWVIDPIDGTRGFVKRTGHFSIHIGLLKDNKPVLGVVHSPALKKLYFAEKGKGAFLNNKQIFVSQRNKMWQLQAALHSRENDKLTMKLYRKVPYQSEESIGGMGNKICSIAEGNKDLLISRKNKVREWDLCAPHVILLEAGGVMTLANGDPIVYNKKNPAYEQTVVISNGTCHNDILKRINS